MQNELLFKTVKCNGFLKPVHDGKFIHVDNDTLDAYYEDNNTEKVGECLCDGSLEYLKTYMQLTQRNFKGVVVGIKNVVVSAWLVADTYSHYNGREYIKVTKEPKEVKECAIVYYANNRKHYVPLECIESEV